MSYKYSKKKVRFSFTISKYKIYCWEKTVIINYGFYFILEKH